MIIINKWADSSDICNEWLWNIMWTECQFIVCMPLSMHCIFYNKNKYQNMLCNNCKKCRPISV